MRNYHFTGKEDPSEKETVRVPSMDQGCMGGAETEYLTSDHQPSASGRRPHGSGGCRIAAAGLAGAILAANAVVPVCAADRAGTAGLKSSEEGISVLSGEKIWWGSKDKDSEEDKDKASDPFLNESASWWDEDEILERWDLDPDDFPSVPEERIPYIEEDLIPYFQEAAGEAVSWYSGQNVPQADLSRYTVRADAIRREVRERIRQTAEGRMEQIFGAARSLVDSAGGKLGDRVTAELQGGVFCRYGSHSGLTAGTDWAGGDPVLTGPLVLQGAKQSPGKPHSLDLLLGDRRKKDAGREADLQESGDSENSEAADAGNSAGGSKESAESGRGHLGVVEVYVPAGDSVRPSPFGNLPDPSENSLRDQRQVPVPIGIYPYSDSYYAYVQALQYQRAQEEAASQEEAVRDEYSPEGSSAEEEYAELSGSDENSDGSETEEKAETIKPGDIQIPLSYEHDDPEDPYVYPQHRKVLFIGDSRTVGMEMFCGGAEDEYWSARNSMGYSWMVSTGIPNVENLIDQNTDIVILMGVNDLGNVYNYVDYINSKAAEWKELGARTYFVSVTPVDDSRSPNAKNSRIENFNAYAQENLQNVNYIDAYSRIRYSFGSPDGIHFDGSTYREIYRIIKFNLYRGWYEQDGLWFYFDNGKPVTGWQYLDGQWQYMDGYGVRWVRDGRVGDLNYVPLPDFCLTGTDTVGPSF